MRQTGSILLVVVLIVLLPLGTEAGDRCSDIGCNDSRSEPNPPQTGSSWSIPTKTVIKVLLSAAKKGLYPTLGFLVPSIGITKNGAITGTVRVTQCSSCCMEEDERLLVVPLVMSEGVAQQNDGALNLPKNTVTVASRGEAILDRTPDFQDGTIDTKSDAGDLKAVIEIEGANTTWSLSFLFGLVDVDVYSSPRVSALQTLSETLPDSARLSVSEARRTDLVPYCGCVSNNALEEEINETATNAINKVPLAGFLPEIEVSLTGRTRVPRAFQATDPDGDPVWVYLKADYLRGIGLQVDIDQDTGTAFFEFVDLTDENARLLAERDPLEEATVYLYDLAPGVEIAPGTMPQEGDYLHMVDDFDVAFKFVFSQPPQARSLKDEISSDEFRELGCWATARFEATDEDPHGDLYDSLISFAVDLARTSSQLQQVTSELNAVCGNDGVCRASAGFISSLRPRCVLPDDEASLPVGIYKVGFDVYERRADGAAVFRSEGTYTLVITNSPPTAVRDEFPIAAPTEDSGSGLYF